ncbi:MAG: HDOD domain-containing protein [Fibrobacterota bacterium]
MPSLLLISNNEREKQILQMAFDQLGFEVIEAEPDRASYVNAVQFKPDVILIKIPRRYHDHLNFCKNISNIRNLNPLILGYGGKYRKEELGAIQMNGVAKYFFKPLKFSVVMKHIEKFFEENHPEKLTWKKDKVNDEYFDMLFDSSVLPTKKIEIMADRISSVMAFPFTVARVLKISNDPDTGAKELSQVINSDAVIAGNIIKVSNAVFFASRNNTKIRTVKDAIIRIGFNETKNITMTISVMKSLSAKAASLGFERKEFWRHSLGVSLICNLLAKNVSFINKSEAFLTGLLHSFGIILLDEFFPDVLVEYLKKTVQKGGSFMAAQRELTLITHLDLSKRLFDGWQIPADINEGIAKSADIIDEFDEGKNLYEKKSSELDTQQVFSVFLYIADIIAKSCQFGNECDQYVHAVPDRVLSTVNIRSAGLNHDFIESVQNDITLYSQFLNLGAQPPAEEVLPTDFTPLVFLHERNSLFPVILYLYSHGITPGMVSSFDQLQEKGGEENMLIYCSLEQPDEEVRSSLEAYAKSYREKNSEELPVLIFEPKPKQEQDSFSYYLPNSFDMRMLDSLFMDIFEKDS